MLLGKRDVMRSPITIAIDLYRFICEEIEDRRMKPEVSRLRLWTRWWAGIGDKINLGIWDGPMETKKEVKEGIKEMKKVLEEVEEGERLVAEAGVKITDPRREMEKRAGRRKIREVVKAGALKAKGYVWLEKQGTRSGEHRRELWMHTSDTERVDERGDDAIFEDKDLAIYEGDNGKTILRDRAAESAADALALREEMSWYADEDAEWTKGIVIYEEEVNEPMTAADCQRMVEELRDRRQRGLYVESTEGLRAWGNVIKSRGQQIPKGTMQVPRGQGKTAADRMTRKLMEEEGYEVEDVPGVGWKATKRDLSD